MTIERIKEAIIMMSKNYPIEKAYLFGSRAAENNRSDSDIDLLIEFAGHVSLLTISSLKIDLEEILKLDVDIVHGPLRENDLLEVEKVIEFYAA